MTWKFLSLAAALAAAVLLRQAEAAPLDIGFLSATQSGAPGATLTFTGTLTNNTGLDVFVNAAVINLAGFGPADSDLTDFILNVAGPLPDGGSIGPADFFTVTIPAPFASGSYSGELTVQGGLDDTSDLALASADFEVDVSAATGQVPEPGTLALMIAAWAAASGVYRHRRRKTSR